MDWKTIEKAVKEMNTVPIKDKEYPPVSEKVKAFKKVYPHGSIITEQLKDDGNVCEFKVYIKDGETVLSTGHAKEEKTANFINKTSYIENCETSAVGRALSFAGFGGDASIASAEEVANAMSNQDKGKADQQTIQGIYAKAKKDGVSIDKFFAKYGVKKLQDLTQKEADHIVAHWSDEVLKSCKE